MTRAHARLETSAGGVVYRMRGGQPLYLLIRDSYQNWGFPKGHIERGEKPQDTAVREVGEETGLGDLGVRGEIETIDWYFKFRGRLVHKVCHFFLMESSQARTCPQRAEGISACKWVSFDEAQSVISYGNAREVLKQAHDQVTARLAGV
jgi:8-oxo-dGTP pyrophosphatase MutT (NUDIX family)